MAPSAACNPPDPRHVEPTTRFAQDTAIDTVVFDLGGVLIDWDVRALFGPRLPDPADVAGIPASHRLHGLEPGTRPRCRLGDRGGGHCESHPTDAEVFAVYPDFFEEALVGLIPTTQKLLAELRSAGIRLLALTNFCAREF